MNLDLSVSNLLMPWQSSYILSVRREAARVRRAFRSAYLMQIARIILRRGRAAFGFKLLCDSCSDDRLECSAAARSPGGNIPTGRRVPSGLRQESLHANHAYNNVGRYAEPQNAHRLCCHESVFEASFRAARTTVRLHPRARIRVHIARSQFGRLASAD